MKKLLIACLLLFAGCDTTWQNLQMHPEQARYYIDLGLKGQKLYPRNYPIPKEKITDEQSFVRAAESVLFDTFGKEEIRGERPYSVGHANGYWAMNGHLWAEHGGVFYIVMSEKTGEVIYLTHTL